MLIMPYGNPPKVCEKNHEIFSLYSYVSREILGVLGFKETKFRNSIHRQSRVY
jgi:hypothetical protein